MADSGDGIPQTLQLCSCVENVLLLVADFGQCLRGMVLKKPVLPSLIAGVQVGVQDGLDVIRQASSADPSSASSKPDMAAREQQQQQANPEPFDFLIIDAGSGDASLPMSCPPPSFLEPGVLKSMAAALKPQGLLAMNCVSRSDAAFREAVAAVQVKRITSSLALDCLPDHACCNAADSRFRLHNEGPFQLLYTLGYQHDAWQLLLACAAVLSHRGVCIKLIETKLDHV